MVMGALNQFGNWVEDQAQKVGIGDGGEWEEVPVEEEAPAPAPAAEPAPSPAGGNDYYSSYVEETPPPAPAPAPEPAPAAEEVVVEDAPEPAPQGTPEGSPYYANWIAEETNQPIPEQFAEYDTGHYVRDYPEPTTTGRDDLGNPLPQEQTAADENILTRYLPMDEMTDAIGGDDGFSAEDMRNPVNVLKGIVFGAGAYADEARQRLVEEMGREGYDRITKGDANARLEDGSVLDKIGNVLMVPYQQLNKMSLSAQGEDKQNLIGYSEKDDDSDGFTVWLENPENADIIKQIYEEGYNGFKEGRALWEYYVSDKSMMQRGVLDLLNDPTLVISAGLGGVAGLGAKGVVGATRAGKVIGGLSKAANIALDPLGEAILPAAKIGLKAIPGVDAGIAKLADSPVNPFKLTDDAKNKIALDSAVTQAEALGRQLDELGTRGIADAPSTVGRANNTAPIYVRDMTTGVTRPFDTTNPMAEFESINRVLGELPYDEYKAVVNSPRRGGINWYELLFNGDRYGLPKYYDNAIPTNQVEHERYIDLFIRRIDANEAMAPGRGGQNVIDGMYEEVKRHAFGPRIYPGAPLDKHLAAWKTDTIKRVLDKGGFVDANAARHANLERRIKTAAASTPPRMGTPPYRAITTPFPYATPRPTTPTRRGSWEDGLIFTDPDLDILRQPLSDGRAFGEVYIEYKNKLDLARQLAQRAAAGPLSASDNLTLGKLTKELGAEGLGLVDVPDAFGALTNDDVNVAAARAARRGLEIKLGVRDAKGKIIDNRGAILKGFDKATNWVKTMTLLNIANILPSMTRQVIGNASTLGISNRRALLDYLTSAPATPDSNVRRLAAREGEGIYSKTLSDVDRIRAAGGLGNSGRIRQSSRTGTLGAVTEQEVRNKLSKVLSPEVLRKWWSVSDLQMRESLYKTTFQPEAVALRRRIRQHAADRASSFQVITTRGQIDLALDALEQANISGAYKSPVYSAQQLRKALEGSGAVGPGVKDWADRVARDYLGARPDDAATGFKGLRFIDDEAFREMERVGFTFNETQADAILNRLTFYHYWNSRAGLLYAREALRNPAMAAQYYRMMEGLNREAEQNNYPDYLRGWLRFMNTPLGYSVYFDPKSFFGTFTTFAEESFANPNGDLRNYTTFGRFLDKNVPLLPNPIITIWLYWAGALGEDAQAPNVTGLAGVNRQALNLVNLWRTAQGQPPIDQSANVTNITNWIASQVSNAFAGLGLDASLQQRVERINPNAGFDSNVNWFIQQQLREQNDGWTDQQIADAAAAIQDDEDNPIVREAMDRAADLPFVQPGANLPGILQPISQVGMNLLKPVYTQARPTVKDDNASIRAQLRENKATPLDGTYLDPVNGQRVRPDQDQTQGIYNLNAQATAATPEVYEFTRAYDGYKALGTQQQLEAQGIYEKIGNGMVGSPISVAGMTFTDADLAALNQDQRRQIARLYLSEQGSWKSLQGLWEAKEQYKQAHPELREYFAFQDNATAYPGGLEAWAQEAQRTNPRYDAYVRDQEARYPDTRPGGSGRYWMLVGEEAFYLMNDRPRTVWDSPTMAPRGDYGPYIPGVPAGQTPLQVAEQGGSSGGSGSTTGGDGGSFQEEQRAELEQDLSTFYGMTQLMNQWDAEMGYAPGTTVTTYLNRLTTGDKKVKIDSGVYDRIENTYGYVFPSKGDLKSFMTWATDPALNPNGSLDIQAYQDWDSIEYARKQLLKPVGGKAPSNISELTSGMLTVRGADGSGPATAPAADTVTPVAQQMLLADPANPYSELFPVGPGLPLRVLQRQGNYVLVEAPGGIQGWVTAGNVRKAKAA